MYENNVPTADNSRQELANGISIIQEQVQSMTITNDDQYAEAARLGQEIKRRQKMVMEFFKPVKDAANKAHREACKQEHLMLDPLAEAEKSIKRAMSDYAAEQERKRREAEEEARRKAAEEAQRLMEQAVALEEDGHMQAAEAVLEAAQVIETAPVVVPQAAKVEGVSTRTDWEVSIIDENKVPVSVAGAVIRPVDMAAVKRLVRATKGKIDIPGLYIREVKNTALRG